ncbi:hypothetical protein PV11_06532 [Exophiala sideris]|uniref:MYND-type domain-containing protein n=1 Tax=Exophiala sideris TaxID=1016849 RepID=A0A0D1YVR4_9EURO|nr:hypothetical protein PV11_06532 [Exophiala sideris]
MATATATSYCFRCQHHPDPDEEPLKRCSKCRSRHYCSQECQRNDWPTHKKECDILAAGGQSGRMRSTFRMAGLPSMRHEPAVADPDTIYYVKTSTPHIHRVTISGPYYPLQNIFPPLLKKLRDAGSVEGERTLDDIVYGGGDAALLSLKHFNAPLPDGNIMRLELVREQNARVAHGLPCEVWSICVNTTTGDEDLMEALGHPPVTDMEMLESFVSKDEAHAAAKEYLQDLKAELGPDAILHEGEMDGLYHGDVGLPDSGEFKILEVKHQNVTVYDWEAAQEHVRRVRAMSSNQEGPRSED